ncbi:hypothetical protein BHE74_00034359 [Ensete ventricosum]|nr:hypothetical protein GW17_00047651 [Ensete ventricosum]RWW58754.1 hypothetical protein BHE74_00034359 [Ensete ventricosum]
MGYASDFNSGQLKITAQRSRQNGVLDVTPLTLKSSSIVSVSGDVMRYTLPSSLYSSDIRGQCRLLLRQVDRECRA